MDTITQAVLGAAVGQAGWRDLGGRALVFGAFCGLVPDFDVLASAAGPFQEMIHHRGFTHSVFFAPLASPLLGYLGWRWAKRRGELRRWIHLAFWGLLTHPLLDVFTAYGTQLLTPLSDRRFAVDGISIVDPLYTLPLMATLIYGYWLTDHTRRAKIVTAATLAATTLYLGFGTYQSSKAKAQAASALAARGFAYEKLRAMPTLGNVWVWRIAARNARGDVALSAASTMTPAPLQFTDVPRPDDPRVAAFLADERGEIFAWFSDGYMGFAFRDDPGGGSQARVGDLRYGGLREPHKALWGVVATFGPQGEVVDVARYRERDMGQVSTLARSMWSMLWSGALPPPDDEASSP